MKQFIVLKNYKSENILPDVVAQFNDHADAVTYAKLSSMSDAERIYSVATVEGEF